MYNRIRRINFQYSWLFAVNWNFICHVRRNRGENAAGHATHTCFSIVPRVLYRDGTSGMLHSNIPCRYFLWNDRARVSRESLKIIFYQYAESGGTAHCEFRTRRRGFLSLGLTKLLHTRPARAPPVNNPVDSPVYPRSKTTHASSGGANCVLVNLSSVPRPSAFPKRPYLKYVRCKNGSI